jgi:PAS domain S-box-containing protein
VPLITVHPSAPRGTFLATQLGLPCFLPNSRNRSPFAMMPDAQHDKPLVLIVEDSEDDVLLLERKLGGSCRIDVARDGKTALDRCAGAEHDLVMIDLKLPDMDGLDLLSRFKELRPRTSAIMMTAYGSEETARKAIRLGASDYVIKSLDFKGIAGLVKATLEKRNLEIEKSDLEKKLRSERDYLRTVVNCSADAIIMTDPEGVITFFSPGAEELFRVPNGEAIGNRLDVYLARGRIEGNRIIHEMLGAGTIRNRGVDFLLKDGSRVITFLSGSVLNDEQGKVTGLLYVIKDITRNIRLEREIFESKTQLESVFDSIVDPLAVVGPDFSVMRANMASARLTGIDVTETVGKKCHVVLKGSGNRCEVCPVRETYQTKRHASAQLSSEELGEIFVVNSYPILDMKGELKGVIEHRKVITEQVKLEDERRRLEMELMERHKLSSIGMLVQGIAHNLNTPLGVILGRSELLKAEIDETLGGKVPRLLESSSGSEAREALDHTVGIKKSADSCLEVIFKQVEHMSDIIGNMMQKSRQEQDSEPKKISLNQVLEEELTFLNADMYFKHDIEKQVHFDPSLPYIEGVYSDFSQSFTNIIRNAIDAMYTAETKVLTVTTRHDDHYVYVIIHDTGEGIKEDDKSKLFDPFFTTKEFASTDGGPTGVGLGLHSCYQLLNPYGVKFEIESRPGDTTFTVMIPIHPTDASEGE